MAYQPGYYQSQQISLPLSWLQAHRPSWNSFISELLSLQLGSTLASCDQIGEILELPKGVFPVVGFSLGYPEEDPESRDRLPLEGLVHDEVYSEQSAEKVREIYREREVEGWKRYMSDEWLRRMVEDAGAENLAQIYTVVKYTRESHQEFSKTVLDYLKKQDFMN